jgi:Xaa-Pro aminopeptidase
VSVTQDIARPPFDTKRLDTLMEDAGIDLLLASSKHNVAYMLGGYRSFFFEHFDAIGLSRYLPVLVYPRGRPEDAAYIGSRMESAEREVRSFWTAFRPASMGSEDAIRLAAEHVGKTGLAPRRIAVETGFLPADAYQKLRDAFPEAGLVDALPVLERLRAVKSTRELALLRAASERVVSAMLAVIGAHGPGVTKRELVEALRQQEVERGLTFEYCLITAGTSLNRAPSEQKIAPGDILSLDSGGNYRGYIGDVCRMGIFGEPDAELIDLLGHVDAIQQAAFARVHAGAPGRAVYEGANAVLNASPHRESIEFVAHGMGLITHEVPHLTDSGPVPYPASDADRPLEAGMVLSIETTLQHRSRGFIKLEDTVAVTRDGYEMMGGEGRGWNRGRS